MIFGRSIGNFEIGAAKTGQTTEYGSGTGADDGFYEKGTARRFENKNSGQYSGTTNITINAKTEAKSNEVVIDHSTKLMWIKTLSASVGPASDGLLAWTTNGSGEGIFAYAAAANAASLAGHNDWRIPNRNELLSIQLMEAPAAKADSTAFGWTAQNLWTSTTQPNSSANAVNIAFQTSGGIAAVVKTNTLRCVLVRSL